MPDRDVIVRYLDTELDAGGYRDYLPVGLQVVGAEQVTRVCTAVSASLEVFSRAADAGAEMLVVHHGLFWDGSSRVIGTLERRRLQALFRGDVSLVAYHLPLDGHDALGNNAILIRMLGCEHPKPFAEHRGRLLGRYGELPAAEAAAGLAARLGAALGSVPVVFPGGPEPVRTVGVVSGAAAADIRHAAELGLDCFVTGEPDEESAYIAAELGVTMIAAGHYATETVGVQAVGQRLHEQFGIITEFLAVHNPV
jgi:dinuclear metal center YbgI/SA1388 family protein